MKKDATEKTLQKNVTSMTSHKQQQSLKTRVTRVFFNFNIFYLTQNDTGKSMSGRIPEAIYSTVPCCFLFT